MIKKYLIVLFFKFFSVVVISQTATGDIDVYIGNIIDNSPGNLGDDYIEPSTIDLNTWDTIITNILSEDVVAARLSASTINYKITEFTDTSINQVFYVLEEKVPHSNYWGTYVFSKTPIRNNLILQAPHSKYDTNTGKQAVFCLKNIVPKALFINGTHRCNSSSYSSCSGTTGVCGTSGEDYRLSDLAHTTTSVFQKTTENLFNSIPNSIFIQLHGFGKRISDPYVIMSNGTREIPAVDYISLLKDALLQEDSSLTFKLAHKDITWTRLIGFTNTQGRLINNSVNHCSNSATNSTGRFIHIEQERTKLRANQIGWIKMSNALSNVFSSTLSDDEFEHENNINIFPNPTSGKLFVTGEFIENIEVFNLLGQKVEYKSEQVDLTNKPDGIYFLKIKTSKGSINRKIVKKK